MIQSRARNLEGWPIVGWSALAVVTMVAIQLGVYGLGEVGVRSVIRGTARSSVGLFTAAFVASSATRLWPAAGTKWMLRNRRYLGVSFAVSHLAHLIAIIIAVRTIPGFELTRVALIGGGAAYVYIALMTATSFDRTAAWIGRRRWQQLHTSGAYYIWGIFATSYLPRAVVEPLWYAPLALLVVAGLGVRIVGRRRRAGAVRVNHE